MKNRPANAGVTEDASLISGLGRSPGGGNGNPLQFSCLENPMDRGARWAIVHGVTKSWTRLNDCTHTHTHTQTPKQCSVDISQVGEHIRVLRQWPPPVPWGWKLLPWGHFCTSFTFALCTLSSGYLFVCFMINQQT